MTTLTDARTLQGKIVLVKSARDTRNPPTAMRGWIEVHETAHGRPDVSIAVEIPQMFKVTAQHRVFALDDAGLERLLASERNGTYEYTVEEALL